MVYEESDPAWNRGEICQGKNILNKRPLGSSTSPSLLYSNQLAINSYACTFRILKQYLHCFFLIEICCLESHFVIFFSKETSPELRTGGAEVIIRQEVASVRLTNALLREEVGFVNEREEGAIPAPAGGWGSGWAR